jgi:hypothetical protein
LRKIVEKLPVDADGDPVIPPAEMWALVVPSAGLSWVCRFHVDGIDYQCGEWVARKYSGRGPNCVVCRSLYKTKQAAEAARAEESVNIQKSGLREKAAEHGIDLDRCGDGQDQLDLETGKRGSVE